jgi:anti-sigma regulatory factor (Ser/Thr protein kinase)
MHQRSGTPHQEGHASARQSARGPSGPSDRDGSRFHFRTGDLQPTFLGLSLLGRHELFAGRSLRSKLLLLVAIPLVAVLVLGAVSLLGARQAANDMRRLQREELVLEDAAWNIRYLDEVLTHSAARYIQSEGDEQWWSRYDAAVVELDDALATAKELSNPEDLAALTAVDDANLRLIELETQIRELVIDGRFSDAREVLQGEYEQQKVIYSDGVDAFFEASVERTGDVVAAQGRRANVFLVVVAVLGVLALGLAAAALVLAGSIIRPPTATPRSNCRRSSRPCRTEPMSTTRRPSRSSATTSSPSSRRRSTPCSRQQCDSPRSRRRCAAALRRCSSTSVAAIRACSAAASRTSRRSNATSAIPGSSTSCSGSITSPPACGATPMTLADIVRSAQSEIEHYTRVDSSRVSHARVRADAVADLTHLVAELLENATNFSEPTTKVTVTGKVTDAGYVLSVVDEGLGMSPSVLADANRRITEPVISDTSGSKLGLSVVGRLAARYDIEVRLYESPADGTVAKVTIPAALLVPEAEEAPADEAPVVATNVTDESLRIANALAAAPSARPEPAHVALPEPIASVAGEPVQSSEPSHDDETGAPYRRRVRGAQLFDTGGQDVDPSEAASRRRNARHDHNRLGAFQSGVRRATTDRPGEEADPS